MQQLSLAISAAPLWFNTTQAGSLTEMIISDSSSINPMQLLPLLSQCNQGQRWLMWLSPHPKMNKQWLQSLGLHQAAVIQLDCRPDNQLQLCLQVIAAGNSHLMIEWQGKLSVQNRQQLEQAAQQSKTEVMLIQRRQQAAA